MNVQGWGEALVNPPLLETIQRTRSSYLDALTQLIHRAQAAGRIEPSLDPQAVGRMLLSLYYGLELQIALDSAGAVEPYARAIKTLLFSAAQPT